VTGRAATPPRSRARAAEQTRSRLVNAAIARFAREGLGASFDAIAGDAGVTKGALYHHFGSKEGLVEEVYKEAVRGHADRVVSASSSGTGRERLFALIDESARLYGSGTPFYRLLVRLHVEAAGGRPHLAPIARRVGRAQREHMIGLARQGQADGSIRAALDPVAVGQTVDAALAGFLLHQTDPAAEVRRRVADFGDLMEALL
jgi:AcrR family transcriptional regulator